MYMYIYTGHVYIATYVLVIIPDVLWAEQTMCIIYVVTTGLYIIYMSIDLPVYIHMYEIALAMSGLLLLYVGVHVHV